MSNNQVHDEHTRIAGLKPDLVGIVNVAISSAETNHFDSKGKLVGQTDNVFISIKDKTIYVTDYKCNFSKSQAEHAYHQTLRDARIYKDAFPDYRVVRLMTYEDFKVVKFGVM